MRDLLKADLKRVLKDKLTMVLAIIAVAFAVVTPLLYKGIFVLLDIEEIMEMEEFGLFMSAKSMFFSSFSLGNNFGFILPILVVIILCKDFSNGTIRNKVICGKSRASIYFSLLITCIITMCAFILIHALLTLLVSLIFFDYQVGDFTINDFGYLMASIGFEMLIYLFVCALLTFFAVFMKNAGLAIVMYFVVNFAMIIIGAISQTAIMFVDTTSISYSILEFINTANAFTTTAIGNGITYKVKEILYLTLPNVIFGALFVILGLISFKKKDLK